MASQLVLRLQKLQSSHSVQNDDILKELVEILLCVCDPDLMITQQLQLKSLILEHQRLGLEIQRLSPVEGSRHVQI